MFGLFPNSLFTIHQGLSGGRGLSPRIWNRVAGQALSPDGYSNWYFAGDDFLSFGPSRAVDTNVGFYAGAGGLYKSYEDTGATIAQIATASGGVVNIAVDADDNQEAWLQSGAGAGVLGAISDTAGSDKMMLFECRFRPSQVTAGNFFLGLSEEGLAAADTKDDSGDLASKDFIGFDVNEDAPTSLSFVYRKAGQSLVTPIANCQTLVAATWYKAGFVYDPFAPTSKRISIYIDNVEEGTYVTGTNIAAATFPDGEELAFLAGVKNVTDTMSLDLDWWFFAQLGS